MRWRFYITLAVIIVAVTIIIIIDARSNVVD